MMAVRTCCLAFPALCNHVGKFGRVAAGLSPAEDVALLKTGFARCEGIVERGGIKPA